MTALQLYQYIHEYDIEWRPQHNHEYNYDKQDVIIFISPILIESFCEMFDRKDDDPFVFHFNGEYFAIYMADICEYYEIDMKQVFKQNQ